MELLKADWRAQRWVGDWAERTVVSKAENWECLPVGTKVRLKAQPWADYLVCVWAGLTAYQTVGMKALNWVELMDE